MPSLITAPMTWLLLATMCAFGAAEPPPPPAPASLPGDPNQVVERVAELLHDDKVDEALDLAAMTVDRWPDHAPGMAALGDALYRRGDFEQAELRYRRAVEIDPNAAAAHFGIGRVLRTLGRYGDAAASFSRAAALSPETPKYLRVLANHLARRQDTIAMLKHYLELVRQRPAEEEESAVKNVEAWVALLELMGDRPIEEMTKKEPCSVPIQVFGGQAYLKMTVAGLPGQKFVFDTGATGVTISHRIAARAKLTPIRPFTIAGIGVSRTETGDLVVVPEMAVGDGIVVRNVPATVRDPSGSEEGLIGPSFFSAFDITVDLKGRRLTLQTPAGTGTQRPGRAEPFRNVGGEIMIVAKVNGEPMNALLDTGSVSTIVARATLRRAPGLQAVPARWGTSQGPGVGSSSRGIGGPMADRKVIIKGTLSFAGRDYPANGLPSGDLTGFSHALESEVYLILGAPHLDDTPFTVDYRNMLVIFTPPAQR